MILKDSDIIIRTATDNDKYNIIELLNNVFKDQQHTDYTRDDNYYNWKFIDSPFGESILTVCEHDRKIIGVDNLWSWNLIIQDKVHLVYEACDAVVGKEYRGNGILKKMRTHGIEKAKLNSASFLFNFPNEQSLKSNINYGYSYLGKLKWWVKIINPIKTTQILLNLKSNNDKTYSSVDELPIDVELLLKLSLKYKPTHLIIIDRTFDFFYYRYLNHPSRHYKMITFKNEIVAIYTINDNYGKREMFITDIIGNKKYINDLLKEIISMSRSLKCAFVAMVSDNYMLDNSLWLKGFIKKKEKNMAVFQIKEKIGVDIKNFRSWNLSASLHDSI